MGVPKSIQTFRSAGATLVTANTGRDGTGTIVTVFTGVAAPGSIVTTVNMAALGNTASGFIGFFLYDGATYRFMWFWPVAPVTVSAGPPAVPPWSQVWTGSLLLPTASWSLRMTTYTGDDFDVVAQGGDYV